MKVDSLNQPLKNFDGNAIKDDKDVEFTYKIGLLNCLGSIKAADGKESVQVWKLGVALAGAENGDIVITAEELLLLKKGVEQNNPGYFPVVQGQLFEYLEAQNVK